MKAYNMLRIEMKDGKLKFFDRNDWGDYEINNGFVIVKDREGAWIAAFNADLVASVELRY